MLENIKNFLKLNKKICPKSVDEQIDDLFNDLGGDTICIKVGSDICEFGEEIANQIGEVRAKIKDKTGLIIPPVRLTDFGNNDFQENEYRIIIQNKTVFTGFTVPKADYACNEIIRELEKACLANVELVLTCEMVEKYINHVQNKNSWLVWYLSRLIPPTGIKVILTDLIKNGKSINDICYIFEKICEQATIERDMCSIRDPYKIAKAVNSEIK